MSALCQHPPGGIVMGAEAKRKQLGITLPAQSSPVANYVPSVLVANLLFLSGHGPFRDGKATTRGKLGKELSVEDGYKGAPEVGLKPLGPPRPGEPGQGEARRTSWGSSHSRSRKGVRSFQARMALACTSGSLRRRR